jgi:hypothetical protein
VRPRFDQTLRQQLVVGRHHRGGADFVLPGALAHAGQARARRQQAVADARGKALGKLLGQGLGRGSHEHGNSSSCGDGAKFTSYTAGLSRTRFLCVDQSTHTVQHLISLSVWLVYWLQRIK